MAYTTALRDHVWVITSDGTVGGVTLGGGRPEAQEHFKTLRWVPALGTDVITVSRVKEDLTQEVVWQSAGGGSTKPEESHVSLRSTRGFNVTMTTGSVLYLYQALDERRAE